MSDDINNPPMDIVEHLASLSDEELMHAFKVASDDLVEASGLADSEWHECCFAGAVIYAQEMGKRGLTLATKH